MMAQKSEQYIKLFSSLSGVRLLCCMSLCLQSFVQV